MATVNLIIKLIPYVDEMFSTESKLSMFTNEDSDQTGAHTVKVYRVNTSGINDYDRPGTGPNASRFDPVAGLDAVTEGMPLRKDRSFTFAIDKLDTDGTAQQLQAITALARQQRKVVVPKVNSYVYDIMSANTGTKPVTAAPATENVYTEIPKASQALDDTEAPETGHMLVVVPAVYVFMRKCKSIATETDIGNDLRLKGVLATLDGTNVVEVPAVRLPEAFGFLLTHPVTTVAPVKLEDYRIHQDPPGTSGVLMEGRIYYDAFVLDNKKKALYYQTVTA